MSQNVTCCITELGYHCKWQAAMVVHQRLLHIPWCSKSVQEVRGRWREGRSGRRWGESGRRQDRMRVETGLEQSDIGGSSATNTLSLFWASIHLPGSTGTCASYITSAGLRRPILVKTEQMFPYPEILGA